MLSLNRSGDDFRITFGFGWPVVIIGIVRPKPVRRHVRSPAIVPDFEFITETGQMIDSLDEGNPFKPFVFQGFVDTFGKGLTDELMLSKTRLGIISALIGGNKSEFTYFQNALNLSDGNLSVQIRKLEEAGYIKIEKFFVDRKPKTLFTITSKGHKALLNLINVLGDIASID